MKQIVVTDNQLTGDFYVSLRDMPLVPSIARFAVFYFPDHYPIGGWGDFIGSFETVEAAFVEASKRMSEPYDNTQVIDLQTGKEIQGGIVENGPTFVVGE